MIDRVGQQFGNYRLSRLLGQGDSTDVYLGEHVHLKTQAAIKVLRYPQNDKAVNDFLSKARITAHLKKHQHILHVLEFAVETDVPFLVTTYIPHGTLRQQHPPGSQAPLRCIVRYVIQASDALQFAHDQGILHCNIKPENMLLGHEQEVLLCGFGTPVSHNPSSESIQERATSYIAPEQYQEKPCPASDQYALALVVYEWLSGIYPFQGADGDITHQHLSPPPPLRSINSAIPQEIEEVVMKALVKDPQERFRSITAFAHSLAQASKIDIFSRARQSSNSQLLETSPSEKVLDDAISQVTQENESQLRTVLSPTIPANRTTRRRIRFSIGIIALFASLLAGTIGLIAYSLTGNVTATTRLQDATATAVASAYPFSNSLVLDDPLHDNSKGFKWNEKSYKSGEKCEFVQHTYHTIEPWAKHMNMCIESKTNFRDFTYQVDMTIVHGDGGGLIFRADSKRLQFYYLYFQQKTGSYTLFTYNGLILAEGLTNSFKIGLNQTNLIGVVARGNTISLYVNEQFVTSIINTAYNSGAIGMTADNTNSNVTEVVYANAKVWKL